MQKPKKALQKSHWYLVANDVLLHKTASAYSDAILTIPKDGMVMFVEYHSSGVRKCKVMFGEYFGWIMVDSKYREHSYFFKNVALC